MFWGVIHRYVEQGNSKLHRISDIYAYVELNLFSCDVAGCLLKIFVSKPDEVQNCSVFYLHVAYKKITHACPFEIIRDKK